jgi:hypothetical protein
MSSDQLVLSPKVTAIVRKLVAKYGYKCEDALILDALDLLDEWNDDEETEEEFFESLQQGIRDIEAGVPGTPVEQFFEEFRRKINDRAE